jgi:hypothetical protein
VSLGENLRFIQFPNFQVLQFVLHYSFKRPPLRNQLVKLNNLAKYLPKYFCIPDLGPKMYIAYGWLEEFIETPRHEIFQKMRQGSTDAHVDISGAVNIMANVIEPDIKSEMFTPQQREMALRVLLQEGGVPVSFFDIFPFETFFSLQKMF